ncbi:hypothetical protein ACFSMW_19785 [Virgibacillus halophilus]|uniref:Small, acid-soluble spore protein gamma-type n=1 Tax=Tigheibacillus halophilus TaxID=361280 RepID=A0ABU5C8N7_9BACI|nr:hypothetical protein [Virgibacillus halophilus]
MKDSELPRDSSELSVEELLAQAKRSGLTYNQAKAFIAKTSGGFGTNIYSDTNAEEVKQEIQNSGKNSRQN